MAKPTLSTESLDSYFHAASQVEPELNRLISKILNGETTGEVLTDWALVTLTTAERDYKTTFTKAAELQSYLNANCHQMVLLYEQWKEGDYHESTCIDLTEGETHVHPNFSTYSKLWISTLAPEGLKVDKHPF